MVRIHKIDFKQYSFPPLYQYVACCLSRSLPSLSILFVSTPSRSYFGPGAIMHSLVPLGMMKQSASLTAKIRPTEHACVQRQTEQRRGVGIRNRGFPHIPCCLDGKWKHHRRNRMRMAFPPSHQLECVCCILSSRSGNQRHKGMNPLKCRSKRRFM